MADGVDQAGQSDWLQVPRTAWDTVVKTVPHLLGILETIEDRSPLGAWALDRLGHLTTILELSSLTRGRVMHYAIPEQLRNVYGVVGTLPRTPPLNPTRPQHHLTSAFTRGVGRNPAGSQNVPAGCRKLPGGTVRVRGLRDR